MNLQSYLDLEGKLWSTLINVLEQGHAIHKDYENKTSEEYFARRDAAARERAHNMMADIERHLLNVDIELRNANDGMRELFEAYLAKHARDSGLQEIRDNPEMMKRLSGLVTSFMWRYSPDYVQCDKAILAAEGESNGAK